MKTKILRLFFLLLLLLILPACMVASAHPGRTDANGGHYDRSTGEYHYHHGYPAHQHENGECPYDFDDKTGENSGSSSSGERSLPTTEQGTEQTPSSLQDETTVSIEKQKKKIDKYDVALYIFFVVVGIILVPFAINIILSIFEMIFVEPIIYIKEKINKREKG